MPSLAEGAPGPQLSCAGGLSQVVPGHWLQPTPVAGIGPVGKGCVQDSERPSAALLRPACFLESVDVCVCVCACVPMHMAVLWVWVSCSWLVYTCMSFVWVIVCGCACGSPCGCVHVPHHSSCPQLGSEPLPSFLSNIPRWGPGPQNACPLWGSWQPLFQSSLSPEDVRHGVWY